VRRKPWHVARDYYIGVAAGCILAFPLGILLTLAVLDIFGLPEWLV